MAWACMASSGSGLLVFIDVTEDRSSQKNSEVYRDIISAQIQSNAAKLIGRHYIVQMDNDPKHTAKATLEFLKVKKWNILQLNSAAVKAWQSITKEETQSLVMFMSSRLKAVIASKGFSTKY